MVAIDALHIKKAVQNNTNTNSNNTTINTKKNDNNDNDNNNNKNNETNNINTDDNNNNTNTNNSEETSDEPIPQNINNDAVLFQFLLESMERELNKSYAGFNHTWNGTSHDGW